MNDQGPAPVRLSQSLSVRLLLLTVAFVMLSEVLIFVPSIARFRATWLQERLGAAHLASLALLEAPGNMVSKALTRELLADVGARAVVLKLPMTRYLMLSDDMPHAVDATVDLRRDSAWRLIRDAMRALVSPDHRLLRVIGTAPGRRDATIEIVLEEKPLRVAMLDYAGRILSLSVIISLVAAGAVYGSLQWLLVRPMRRLTASMMAFRQAPEDATRAMVPSGRRDEIGLAERELSDMQRDLRLALQQKTRLAALGAAVAKVNHDLRNILTTAQLVSDRLADSDDPLVRRLAPQLVAAVDRAISLCARTLKFGRADEPAPQRARFPLKPLLDEVAASIGLPADGRVRFDCSVPEDFAITADREQMYRVLLNLGRNAVQAITGPGRVSLTAVRVAETVEITVEDSGGGLPTAARQRLFEPFAGAGRAGGTGLGLAIARELARAHGGDVTLVNSGPQGTCFRLVLPAGDGAQKQRVGRPRDVTSSEA